MIEDDRDSDNSKTFVKFLLKLVDLPAEVGALITGDYGRCTPGVKHVFQQFLCLCEGIGPVAGGGSIPSGKHTDNNKDISVTHTRWQLNEVQLWVIKGSPGNFDASGNKHSFSRIISLTGQALVVNVFCHFVEVSPELFIYNMNHLNCPMAGKGVQKQGMGYVREWVLVYPVWSLIQEQTVATLQGGHQDGKSRARRGQGQNGLHPHLSLLPSREREPGRFPDAWLLSLRREPQF